MPNILLEDVLKANKKPLREAKQLNTNAPEYEGLSTSEIVEKVTGLDMFEQRDAILNALNQRFDASNLVEIETMNVEAVEVQEDGSLKVTYDIYGRPIALYEKVSVTLPVMDASSTVTESEQSDCSAGPLSADHQEMIKKIVEKQKLVFSNAPDILDSYNEGCEFVVELDNSNPTYIAELESDLYKLEDDYNIGFEKESNGEGFYAYSYRFFYYED